MPSFIIGPWIGWCPRLELTVTGPLYFGYSQWYWFYRSSCKAGLIKTEMVSLSKENEHPLTFKRQQAFLSVDKDQVFILPQPFEKTSRWSSVGSDPRDFNPARAAGRLQLSKARPRVSWTWCAGRKVQVDLVHHSAQGIYSKQCGVF